MATWHEITRDPEYQELTPEGKSLVKKGFFDRVIAADPEYQTFSEDTKKAIFDDFWQTPDDTGQGYVTSMLGAAGRGFGEMVPGAIEGVGALTGSEGLREFGQDVRGGLESISPVNPIYAEGVPAKLFQTGGQVGSVLATAGAGGLAGKALGGVGAVSKGAQTAALGSAFLQGSAEGAREAEQYGMTGPEAYLRTLAGGAIEAGTEFLPFGLTAETALAKRLLTGAPRTGTFLGAVGSEAGEEGLGQIASNIATKTLAPAGVETPGITEGALEAAAYGAAGGAMIGGVNALISTPPERQTQIQKDLQAEAGAIPKETVPDQTNEEKIAAMEVGGTTVVDPDGKTAVIPPAVAPEEQPSMPLPDEIVIAEKNLKATENVPFTDVSGQAAEVIIEQNNQIASQPTIQPKQAVEEVEAEVEPETPSLPETGPPVVDQEAPAGTTVQAAPIQPVETQEDAAPEIPLEESLRQEPQDRIESREAEETGAGDQLLRPAEGEEEVGLARYKEAISAGLDKRTASGLGAAAELGAMARELQNLTPDELRAERVRNFSGDLARNPQGTLLGGNVRPTFFPDGGQEAILRSAKKGGYEVVAGGPIRPLPGEKSLPQVKIGKVLATYPSIESFVDAVYGAPQQIAPQGTPTTATEGMVTPGGVATERDLLKPYANIAVPDLEKLSTQDWGRRRDYLEGKFRNNQQEKAELLKTPKQNWESREYNENARINEVAASLRAAIQDMQLARPDLEAEFKAKSSTQTESRGDAEVARRSEGETRTTAADVGGANGELRRESETLQRVSEQPPASANLGDKATGSGTVQPNSSRLTSNVEKFASKIRAQFKADELTEKEEDLKEKYYSINASAGKSASEAKDKAYSAWKRTEAAAKKARADAFAELRRQNKGFTLAQIADKEPFILARTLEKHGIVNEAIQAGYTKQGDLYVFQPQTTKAAAETQTPESVGRGLGGSRGVQSEPSGGSIPEVAKVSTETETTSTEKSPVSEAAMSYLMDDLTDAQKAKWTPEMFAAAQAYFDGGGKDFDALQKVVKFPRVVSQAYLKADKAASEEQARIDKAQRATDAEIAKAEREEKKLEAEMLKREEMRSKAIDSIIGAAEKKKRKFGQVTNSDAIAAVAMLVSSKDVPGVLTTWTGTKEDFLRDPANRMADPEIYARIKAGELVEGFFNKGRAYVFLDGIGVSEADMLRGEQIGVSAQIAAVRRVLLHESLVHRGIHGLPLRHRRLILNWVRQNSTPQELDELASLYTEYANWRNSDYEFEALAEELLAKKVDSLTEIPKDGPMAKLMDILRQIWDFIVGYKREPTLSDLKSVIKLLKSGAEALANDRLKDGGEVKLSMIAPTAGITPEMDAEYLAAVEAGDMEKVQRMVDEAAKAAGVHPKQIKDLQEIAALWNGAQRTTGMSSGQLWRKAYGLESRGNYGLDGYVYVSFQRPATDVVMGLDKAKAVDENTWGFIATQKPLSVEQIKSKRLAPIDKALNAAVKDLVFSGLSIEIKNASGEYAELLWTKDPATNELRVTMVDKGGPWGHHTAEEVFSGDTWASPERWMDGTIYDSRLPSQIKSADPVTYDNAGNVIPLSQRFQTASQDIRFSRPQFASETSAALTTGSEAARSSIYSERDMDIREAIRHAYEAMPKTNSVAVPIGELFAKTEELMPGVTQEEFSLVLQDLFEDNAAVLQEGDVVEPLTENDRRYLALAQDEDANREELQKMVDEAAGVPKVFDAQSGIGQVPFNRAVSSRGFRKAMTQKEFRSLVPSGVSGPSTKNYVEDAIRSGKKIGQPFLMVKWDDKNKRWVVTDHEGRSRIDAFDKVFQGKRAEVHIFPSGLMAKDLTPEMKNAPFQKQGVLALGEDYIKKFGVYDFGKSLDAITRDDQGRIIPLSRRFDTGADIRGQINVTTPEGKRAGFVVVMPSKSISVPIALRSMATSEPSKQPINQQKYDEALAAISDFLSGKQTIQFPGKLALSSNTGAGFIADDSRITQGLGEAARTTGGETGTGTAGGQPSDAQVQGVAQQGFGPYSVRNLVGEASRIGVADVRIDPESKHGAYTTVSESGEIYIGINPARMANRIAANDGDVQYAIGSILNEELIHAADMAVLREQWLTSGSKLTFAEFIKEQDVKTVREMIQVAKSSNDPVASTRILFDAITSSVNLYAGNDVTSLDSVETFLNAASHDEISSVMGEFVRQMIQTGLYQTVSEKTLFRKFIEKVKALARKIADVFAPAKEGRYGKLIQERLNGIEELLAYASTKTGAKASRIKAEDATEAAKTFQADIIEAGKGRIDTDSYQGNTLKSTEAPDHNVNAPELYKDAAISLVDSLLKKHSITDIANSFQDPEFRVAVGLLGNKAINPNVAQQAELFTGAEIQSRLEKAFRDESDPAKKRLIEKTLKNHKAYYTVATGIGQNLNAVGALQQDPRFKWMFLFNEAEKEMADKGKEKLDAITGGTQPVTDTVNQSEEAAADEATKQIEESVEEDEYANLLNEGEEGLEGRRKTIWERAKMILRRLAMYARADKMDVKTGSKASLSAEQRKELDELNAILRMPKAERDKAREKDLAEFDDLMAEFLGLESDAKTPERKNTRAKRKKMVDTAKKRAEAGKSIDISDTESAVKIVLREMGKARPGKQVPLTKLMPWKDILAQKAKTVEEYRQRILDAMMASDAFKEVSDEDKAKIADIFAKKWDKKRTDILDRMLEREIDRKRKEGSLSEAAAKALQKSRNKIIELANLGGFDNDDLMKVLGEKFGIKTGFSEAEKARISELADKLQDETLNPAKRNKLAMEFAIELAGAMDVSIIEIIANWWTSSVLFGPQTIFSIGAAFLNGGYSIATIGIRRSLARLTKGDVQGALEESILMLKGFSRYLGAFKQAGRRAWGYLWTGDVGLLGIGSNDILSEISNFEQLQKFQRHKLLAEQLAKDPKRVRRYVGIYLRFVSRLLTALDAFNVMVTKATTASLALRMSGMSTENIIKAEKMLNLKAYKDQVIRDYFDNKAPRTPYEKGLVDSYAEAEMYRAIDKMGGKMENADYLASESAMTMNPTGLGGFFYRSITGLDSKMKKAAEDYLEKTKKEWTTEKDLESALFLGLAYLRQFAVQNLGGVAGYKFIRFASNKFNQGISYLPMVGLLRTLEAKGDEIKGKEAFIETIHRNQVIGAVLTLAAIAVVKAIEEEPDDDERGNFWNGGWQNLTPDQKKQMLAKGQEEYTMGFKFNGRWYVFKYQNWPMNQVLAAIGSMSDQIRFSPKQWKEKGALSKQLAGIVSGLKSTLEIPALSQLGTLVGNRLASKDPTEQTVDRLSNVASGWVGGFVPRILKDLDFATQPELRKYKTLWEKTASHIPIYRRYVGEDYYDILGQPIKRNVIPGSREFMMGPTEPEYKILGALNSRNIFLTPANAEYRMVGKGRNRRRLTQEEADAYSLETGKGYRQMLLRYGQRALQMPTERARAFLSDKADEVRDRALKKVYRGYK